jgi:putative ABC transport system permease protein
MESGFGRGAVYHPVARGASPRMNLIVRLRADPASFASRLRSLAADVDATLRLENVRSLTEVSRADQGIYAWGVSALIVLTLLGLMLSLAGIYSVMSFTVARRTREIGIRVALGARARRLVPSVFRRPLGQLLLGIAAGALLMGGAADYLFGGLTLPQLALVGAYSSVMLCVCMLACVVPTRRALRIEPIEALNVEG